MDSILKTLTSGAKFGKKQKNSLPFSSSLGQKRNRETPTGLPRDVFSLATGGSGDADADDSSDSVSSRDSDSSDDEDNDTCNSNAKRLKLNERSSDEDIKAFRHRLQIRVKGSRIPPPIVEFKEAKLPEDTLSAVLRNIEEGKWKEPTPIQMQAIPAMTAGRDVLASAPTGSGKTAAFVLPALGFLSPSRKQKSDGIQVLLLAPTRELAEQIHRETERLCTGKRFRIGLVKKSAVSNSSDSQRCSAYSKYDLLVSTPMRIVMLLRAKAVDLSRVRLVVLDEADRLFEQDSGMDSRIDKDGALEDASSEHRSSFLSQVDEILAECGTQCRSKDGKECDLQRALFSATIGPFVQELASSFLNDPIEISVGKVNAGASSIKQRLVYVGREDGKLLAIRQLIQNGELKPPVLIFLQNKERAKELFKELVFEGINVDVMHGDRSQQQREEVIRKFRLGETWVLICTDLMARGIDFKGVQMVINYDLPQSGVAYIHRIGRTGRAGREGESVTLFTESDIPNMRSIANVMKLSGSEVPDWLVSVKQLKTKEKRSLRQHAPRRRNISTVSKYDKRKQAHKAQMIRQSKFSKKKLEAKQS